MKSVGRGQLTLDQLISMVELIDDQLQDLRVKLRTETKPDMIQFRITVVTHYRNMKVNLLNRVDTDKISKREIIGLLHHN